MSLLARYCRGFGSLVELSQSKGRCRGLSVVKGLIRGCDLVSMPHVLVLRDRRNYYPIRLVLSDDRFRSEGGATVINHDSDTWRLYSASANGAASSSSDKTAASMENRIRKGKAPMCIDEGASGVQPLIHRLASVVVVPDHGAGPIRQDHGSTQSPNHVVGSVLAREGEIKQSECPSEMGPEKEGNSPGSNSRAAPVGPKTVVVPNPPKLILPDLNLMVAASSSSLSSGSPSHSSHRSIENVQIGDQGCFDWAEDLESCRSFDEENENPDDELEVEDDVLSTDSLDQLENSLAVASKLGIFGRNSGKTEEHFVRMWEKKQVKSKEGGSGGVTK